MVGCVAGLAAVARPLERAVLPANALGLRLATALAVGLLWIALARLRVIGPKAVVEPPPSAPLREWHIELLWFAGAGLVIGILPPALTSSSPHFAFAVEHGLLVLENYGESTIAFCVLFIVVHLLYRLCRR